MYKIFGGKFGMLIMKSGKQQMTEEIELQNKKNQNAQRKGNLQILENIGSGHQISGDKIKEGVSLCYINFT